MKPAESFSAPNKFITSEKMKMLKQSVLSAFIASHNRTIKSKLKIKRLKSTQVKNQQQYMDRTVSL